MLGLNAIASILSEIYCKLKNSQVRDARVTLTEGQGHRTGNDHIDL